MSTFSHAIALLSLFFTYTTFAQNDPILFTVNDQEVRLSEFSYIYNKTNGDRVKFDEASIKEYLELYINFKLQVAEGVDMGLDKNTEVVKEQNQYKKQLASTYLTDREITEKLVKEAYTRSLEDRNISHILIALGKTPTEEQINNARNKANRIRKNLTPENFEEYAKKDSDDGYSKKKGGNLGYFTSLQLPYNLETAAYETEIGQLSDVVQTKFGFHIVKVNEVREAYGQIKIGHILARTNKDPDRAKVLIDSLYEELKKDPNFEELAKVHSQDNGSKRRGGQIGWIGINTFDAEFENQVFALGNDGAISKPLESSAGWHIIKRYQAVKKPKYIDVKSEITSKIKKKPRFELVQNALVSEIKEEGNFKMMNETVDSLISMLGDEFTTYKWRPDSKLTSNKDILFTIGDTKASIREFITIAQRSHTERLNRNSKSTREVVMTILDKLITQKCLAYEETQLERKYPEFKALMREYEEGILLFEVKKQLIWDKASSDEEGLLAFYEENKSNYKWKERAKVTFYTLNTTDEKLIKKIQAKAKKKSADEVRSLFNGETEVIQYTSGIYEPGKNAEVDQLKWKKGFMSPLNEKNNMTYFTKLESVVSPTVKSLDEARGYVVADYQDYLEKELIKKLKTKFKVNVNEDILTSMIKE